MRITRRSVCIATVATLAACAAGRAATSAPGSAFPTNREGRTVGSAGVTGTDANARHAGFDISRYPGDSALAAWKYPASPYKWVGFYLPSPCHRDTTWSGTLPRLRSMSWGVAAIYVGQQDWANMPSAPAASPNTPSTQPPSPRPCQSALLTASQGAAEAGDAIAKLQAEGFPEGSVVFLNVETVKAVSPALADYYRAWMRGILHDGRYKPGVYAAKSNADALHAITIADGGAPYSPPFWVSSSGGFSMSSAPRDVGLGYAQLWQGIYNVAQSYGGVTLTVDVNVASKVSPSTP